MNLKLATVVLVASAALFLSSANNLAAQSNGCSANQIPVTFNNKCIFDVWLGEFIPGQTAGILPTSNTWQIDAGKAATVCLPTTWQSGRFWARTGCTGSGTTLNCLVGQCTPPCTNPPCPGSADCVKAGVTGGNPQSIFELTLNPNNPNAGTNINFDISLANGFTVPILAKAVGTGCTRSKIGCERDLLVACPAALQWTLPPVAASASGDSSLPCGKGTFCPSGYCVNGNSCLVGCFDPSDACIQQASSVKPLKCNVAIPNASGTDCSGNTIASVPYLAMYMAKNFNGQDAAGNNYTGDNNAMQSSNQGTPTCFGDNDCPPSTSCVTSGFKNYTPPASAGVCLNLAGDGSSNSYPGTGSGPCSQSLIGQACGGEVPAGFSNGLGYTCQQVTYTQTGGGGSQTAYVCVPPLVSGLGACGTSSLGQPPLQLYTGVAGVTNPSWVTAALQAGANKKTFYQIFKEACPTAYSWSYDDPSSDWACQTVTALTVDFCLPPSQ